MRYCVHDLCTDINNYTCKQSYQPFVCFATVQYSLHTDKICLHPQMHAQETLIWWRNKKEENFDTHIKAFLRHTLKQTLFMCAEHFTMFTGSVVYFCRVKPAFSSHDVYTCTCANLFCLRTYKFVSTKYFVGVHNLCYEYETFYIRIFYIQLFCLCAKPFSCVCTFGMLIEQNSFSRIQSYFIHTPNVLCTYNIV